MNNKVKFLRGTSNEYAVAEKDSDTIYFTTDDGKLYIGDKEVSGDGGLTIDDTLSDTSTNPVQGNVIKQAIDNKADKSLYGDTTINVGRKAETDVGEYSTAEGYGTAAIGRASHAEGHMATARGNYSHAEGAFTTASGIGSHAEGSNWSVAQISMPDRIVTISDVDYTIIGSNAYGINSHAEGAQSFAYGYSSHAEGYRTTAIGVDSHTEGSNTTASGNCSHTSGYHTKALHDNEAAYGKYNESNDNTLFSIGDGTADDARHNAFEITTNGGKLHDKDIATLDSISNPNLLINPDFKINQRNVSGTFSETGKYFVDRWKLVSGTVTINTDGTLTLNGSICQPLENAVGTNVTTSVSAGTVVYDDTAKTFTISANGETISWAKLEYGSVNTPFVTPDISYEMLKCLRYFEKIEYPTSSGLTAIQWKNDINNCVSNIPFFTKRISSPTVTFSGGSGWRFVSNTGTVTLNSGTIASIASNNVGVSFALASATTTPSFGWVDRFSVIIEAEL